MQALPRQNPLPPHRATTMGKSAMVRGFAVVGVWRLPVSFLTRSLI